MDLLDENDWIVDNNPTSNPFTGTFDVNIIRTHILHHNEGVDDYFDMEQVPRTSVFKSTEIAVLLCRIAKPVTSKLFLYIVYELLKSTKDYIDINPKLTQQRLDISRASLYTAIDQLEDFKIITRKRGRNLYWINTQYLFCGNRIAYMEVNAKDRLKIVHQRSVHKS